MPRRDRVQPVGTSTGNSREAPPRSTRSGRLAELRWPADTRAGRAQNPLNSPSVRGRSAAALQFSRRRTDPWGMWLPGTRLAHHRRSLVITLVALGDVAYRLFLRGQVRRALGMRR